MQILAQKIRPSAALTLRLLTGVVIMAAALVVVPAAVFSIDEALLTDGFVWAVVLILMLAFASVGFFGFLHPYLLFRRLPEVQAETDGTYLYIHGRKEAKIPLSAMEGARLDCETPYVMTSEFLVHLFSERYGTVIIKVPGYGKYKLYYVSRAQEVPDRIAALAERT